MKIEREEILHRLSEINRVRMYVGYADNNKIKTVRVDQSDGTYLWFVSMDDLLERLTRREKWLKKAMFQKMKHKEKKVKPKNQKRKNGFKA